MTAPEPDVFPTLPWGRLDLRHHRDPLLVEAEAWAWRIADASIPDTAQGRMDAWADAGTFRLVATDTRGYLARPGTLRGILRGEHWGGREATELTHAAFIAVPALRGER